MCFAFAYSDSDGVSVNLFKTRKLRDAAVRKLLGEDFDEENKPPYSAHATAQAAWDAYVEHITESGRFPGPDFYLAFGELIGPRGPA